MHRHFCLASFALFVVLVGRTVSAGTDIDVPDATATAALGINDRSEIVGSFDNGTGTHGFLRSQGQFTAIDVPGASSTIAAGISNRGQVVGSFSVNGQAHAFLLDNGHFTTLDPPGATSSHAFGINDLAQIVGQYTDGSGPHGFLWTHGQFTTLNLPGAVSAEPHGINRSGQIVGVYRDLNGIEHGFRLEAGGTATLFDPLPPSGVSQIVSHIEGINDRGESAGWVLYHVPGGPLYKSFQRGVGLYQEFDPPFAHAINSRDQIVGHYLNERTMVQHGFLITPAGEIEDISGLPSVSGARVPAASVVVDNDLAVWTLGPGQEILRGGVQMQGGYGTQILWYRGSIYVLGDDNNWWRWTGRTWVFAGSQDPAS